MKIMRWFKSEKITCFVILKYKLFILVICIYVTSLTVELYGTRSKWLRREGLRRIWYNASIIRLILNNQAKTLKVEFHSFKICALIIIMYNALYKSFHSFNTVKISLKSSLKPFISSALLGRAGVWKERGVISMSVTSILKVGLMKQIYDLSRIQIQNQKCNRRQIAKMTING